MRIKIGKTFELRASNEVLWDERGSWDNKQVHEEILEESLDLDDKEEVRVSYLNIDEKYGLVKESKPKEVGEIRKNYFWLYDERYSPVVQNI